VGNGATAINHDPGSDAMLAIPHTVSISCPRCRRDIELPVDISYSTGLTGNRLTARVADYAGPVEQHYRDAGHAAAEDTVAVRVHTLCMN